MTTWTDWRGNDYTEGDTVLYARMSGRSCEMAEGVVVELYEVYYGRGWHKLKSGETAPLETVWKFREKATGEVTEWNKHGNPDYEPFQVKQPKKTERRARILPTNRTSRFGGYWNKKWTYDEATGKGEYVETEMKPVTLKITESITVPLP